LEPGEQARPEGDAEIACVGTRLLVAFALAAPLAFTACNPSTTGPTPTSTPNPTSTPTIERLDTSSECDVLVPSTVPKAVEVTMTPPPGAKCAAGLADGTGHVAIAARGESGSFTFEARAPDGAPLGRFEAAMLVAEPEGWQGLRIRTGPPLDSLEVDHVAFAPSGAAASSATVSPDPTAWTLFRWTLAQDPRGGSLASFAATTLAGNHWNAVIAPRFDAGGALRAAPVQITSNGEAGGPAIVAGGVSIGGGAFVVWQRSSLVWTRWLGADGTPSGEESADASYAEVTGIADFSRLRSAAVELVPLLDGSLVLRVDGAWTRRYVPGSAAGTPPPDWLTSRAGWTLRFTDGNRGYALLPPAGEQSPDCEQAIELRSPSGRLCARVTFRASEAGPCTTGAIAQGWDGTVVQQVGVDACTYRWWPRMLGAP
jgi:hypothetical protein